MTDEDKSKDPVVEPTGKEPDKPLEKDKKPLSLVDEAKAVRDEILKAKEELKAENDRKEKIQTDEMLGGTGGGHIQTETKEETPKEYNNRIEKEISEGKHND